MYQGKYSNYREWENLTAIIERNLSEGELNNAKLFVFTENLVFESMFYKGTLKITLFFGIVLHFHQVQMKGELILHIIHIVGTHMIEAGIDGLSRGNNFGGMMRGLNPLKCVPLGKGDMERSEKLDPWMRSWWVDTLTSM